LVTTSRGQKFLDLKRLRGMSGEAEKKGFCTAKISGRGSGQQNMPNSTLIQEPASAAHSKKESCEPNHAWQSSLWKKKGGIDSKVGTVLLPIRPGGRNSRCNRVVPAN